LIRAAVLLDGGYFSKINKKYFSEARVDLLKLSNILCEGYFRLITYYYDCMPYQSGFPTMEERTRYANKHRFITALRKLERFEVRLGRLGKRGNTFQQKGVDVSFALDLARLSERKLVDKAIIVAGARDFVPAVQFANEQGIITQNVYYPRIREFSYHLRDTCLETREITQDLIDSAKF